MSPRAGRSTPRTCWWSWRPDIVAIAQQTEFRRKSARGNDPTSPFFRPIAGSLMVNRINQGAAAMALRDFMKERGRRDHGRLGRLTSGVTGMAIAVAVLVSGGIENLSVGCRRHDVGLRDHRRVQPVRGPDPRRNDFTAGVGGWTGGIAARCGRRAGRAADDRARGPRGIDARRAARRGQAVFTFDLIGGDSLDNETATVMINGQPVTIATGNHGSISLPIAGVPGVTVETTIQSQGQQLGGSNNDPWRESVTTSQHHRGQSRQQRDARRRLERGSASE
jgi:hypothetical protein